MRSTRITSHCAAALLCLTTAAIRYPAPAAEAPAASPPPAAAAPAPAELPAPQPSAAVQAVLDEAGQLAQQKLPAEALQAGERALSVAREVKDAVGEALAQTVRARVLDG